MVFRGEGGRDMSLGELTDFAFFVQDFNTKEITSDKLYELYGVKVGDKTDLIEAVNRYYLKHFNNTLDE